MKITCVLVSYNRPTLVRQSLKSLADQTHRDFELIVCDNSTLFDIHEVLREFDLPAVRVLYRKYDARERASVGILGINLNAAMPLVSGSAVSFLCDDDYYYPNWFADASRFLEANPSIDACYGHLYYSSSHEMVFPTRAGHGLFVPGPLHRPACCVDHNQVVHRRFDPPYVWPEDMGAQPVVDAVYFTRVAEHHPFHAVDVQAVVKRQHSKNMQATMPDILSGKAEGLRE